MVANARRESGARKGEHLIGMAEEYANVLEEMALRGLPLGSSALAVVLAKANHWRRYILSEREYTGMLTVLRELPDVPPRTGDCAELLADTPGTESS